MGGKKARDQESRRPLSSRAIRKRLNAMEVDLEKARAKRDRAQAGLEALELAATELTTALVKAELAERLADELAQIADAAAVPHVDPEPEPEPAAVEPEPEPAAEPGAPVEHEASDAGWVAPERPVRSHPRRARHPASERT
jgi:hypothetical protein